MPRIKSAKKALRQSLKHRRLNVRRRDAAKDTVRRFKKLVAEKKIAEARTLVPQLHKAIDKAAKHGRALKKQTANRIKSRLLALLKRTALPASTGSPR